MWESVALTLAGTAGNNIGKVLQKKGTLILPPLSLKLKVFPLRPFARFLPAPDRAAEPFTNFVAFLPVRAHVGGQGVRVEPALDQRVPHGHVRRRAHAHRALPGPGTPSVAVSVRA
jgi:hypothetical protein